MTASPTAQPRYVLSIDQGTTSSRAILFAEDGQVVCCENEEFPQIYPQEGWTEHDPMDIVTSVLNVVNAVMQGVGASAADIAGIGITNQRETTVAWDRDTGKPLHNALVWLDLRTTDTVTALCKDGGQDRFRSVTGLPVSTYFSAVKMKWLIDNVPAVSEAIAEGRCMFGTIDSWLVYNLSGQKVHVTDVTNASRYMLMGLEKLEWDEATCKAVGVPVECLPRIVSNCEEVCRVAAEGPLQGVPVLSMMGDQHAALLGHGCLEPGQVKNTYGTGCFMLMNTNSDIVPSKNGLLTTIGFQLGPDQAPVYALEGSVACAGRAVQWLRDQLGLISTASEIGDFAAKVPNTAGVTFVPAFSGLFAPHWRQDARAVLCGMTLASTKEHVCRALLEAVAMQAVEVCEAMEGDSDLKIESMFADGGMTRNLLLMQMQADFLARRVCPAIMPEATAFGVGFAAGLAAGFWPDLGTIKKLVANQGGHRTVDPQMSVEERGVARKRWADALQRTLGLDAFHHVRARRHSTQSSDN